MQWRNGQILTFKIEIGLLICFILPILVVPVSAVDYNVGVIPGHYVKYGIQNASPNTFFYDMDWMKYEVTSVSGKNATLLNTGIYKNGTLMPGNGVSYVYNIEKNAVNGFYTSSSLPIIASNLNQGDPIPYTTLNVNRTENRIYLSISRTVNIVEETILMINGTLKTTYVYDRATGMSLEAQMEQTDSTGILTVSYSVTETNIFGPSPTPIPSPTASISPTPSQIGVSVGDTFTYTVSSTSSYLTPTALFDTHNILLDIRDATWVNIRIVDTRTALNKSYVKYDEIVHYKNGTEGSSTSEIELGTTHGFPIIMANLNVDDNWFHDESEEYPTTKEIITITYPDGRREVNHIFVYLTSRILDMFFDRSTGMPIKLTFNDPTGVATIELSDSSSWVVPEFPSFIVVSFLMAAVLAGAIIYKKKPKTRK